MNRAGRGGLASLLLLSATLAAAAPAPTPLGEAAETITRAWLTGAPLATGYKRALLLEAVIRLHLATGDRDGLNRAVERARELGYTAESTGVRSREPFNCLPYWLYQATGDSAWAPGIIRENVAYFQSVERSPEGAILHPRSPKRGGGHAVLIDALQDYTFRLAVLGRLTGETRYFAEAARQYDLYAGIVRDPPTGLWAQGRGWGEDPEALSPGAWSRGHGWLIRGLVDTLLLLPPDEEAATAVRGRLEDLAQALVRVQLPSGLWPCLLHLPPEASPPEVSGTALIAGNLALAVAEGWLPDEPYARAARRAFAALPAFVEDDGTVRSVSPGPGPLSELGPWQVASFPPGDEHGPFAILFAALGETRLDGE